MFCFPSGIDAVDCPQVVAIAGEDAIVLRTRYANEIEPEWDGTGVFLR